MKPSTVITLVLLLFAATLLAVPFAAQVGAYSIDAPTTITHHPLPPAFSPPLIHHASVHPDKVLPGDLMTVTAEVSSGTGIISVTADMGGIETISLRLVEGSAHNGTWQADWLVHDTEFRAYVTTVTATNSAGETSSYDVNWSDDPDPKWWNDDWKYRRKITIERSQVNAVADPATTYANFPVLVYKTGLSNIKADGADIRFTDSSGTQLPREIEYYSGGALYAWVKFTLTKDAGDGTNDEIYMYYGNSDASEPAAGATYGSQNVWNGNYLSVLHLDEDGDGTADEYKDSTSNGNDARGNNVATGVNDAESGTAPDMTTSGKIDNAQTFIYANKDAIKGDVHPIPAANTGKRTYEFWVNTNPAAQATQCFFSDNCPDSYFMRLIVSSTGVITQNGAAGPTISTAAGALTNGWHQVVFVIDGTTSSEIFVDGVSKKTAAVGWSAAPAFGGSNNLLRIGRTSSSAVANRHWFGGIMDEWRVSDNVRSDEWIGTGYNNQNDPGTFAPVGDEYKKWESYSDSGHGTQCDAFESYETQHTVYMFGEGFTPSTAYRIIYWDGDGVKRITEDKSSEASGDMSSSHTFVSGTDKPGTWYATVYDSQDHTPASHDAADEHIFVDDSFSVTQPAIPEFSTVLAAIAVCMLCAVAYVVMRRKVGEG